MRVPLGWLAEWIELPASQQELTERLTLGGLEIENVEHTGPDLSGLVVGEVLECAPHPNADRLSLCRVEAGDGEPADVVEIVAAYSEWLAENDVPKLLVRADPGAILNGPQLEFAQGFANQTELTVAGSHFIQEDSPHEIGAALAEWYPTTA